MKNKIILISCFIVFFANYAYTQRLEVVRTYWDWGRTQLHERYTVIAGTPTKHGYYKEYNQAGALWNTAHYNHGVLHGQYVQYCGGIPEEIWYIENYVNGKKNGKQISYSWEDGCANCISEIEIYKNDKLIEFTKYYVNRQNNGRKARHVRFAGDIVYSTSWYENGNIQSKDITPLAYTDSIISGTYFSESGKLLLKVEDNIYSFYDNEGQYLIRKEYKNTGAIEYYEKGELVKSVRPIKEEEFEFTETVEYENGKVASLDIKDKYGNTIEDLKTHNEITEQYNQLHDIYRTKILPDLDSLSKEIKEYNEYLNIRERDDYHGYCRKGSYESTVKIDSLIGYLNLHKANITNNVKRSMNFYQFGRAHQSEELNKIIKIRKERIHSLEELLDTIDVKSLRKDYYTLFEIRDVIENMRKDLYYIECSYTYYWGQQSYKDNVPNKHANSYIAYIRTTRYLTSKLQGKNVYETLDIMKQYATICLKMRQWYNKRIGKIERAFGRAKSEEEMLKIFLSSSKE